MCIEIKSDGTIEKENGETIHIQWHINTQRKDIQLLVGNNILF